MLAGRPLRPRKGRFLTIDMDSRHLWLALAEHVRGKTRFHRMAMEPLGEDVALDDPASVGRAIRAAMRKHKLYAVGAVMSLRRAQVVLKPMVLPRPDSAFELASMVKMQLGKDLSLEPNETIIDYAIESFAEETSEDDEPGGLEVLAAAVRVPIVDFCRAVARETGLRLFRVGLRPYADMFAAIHAKLPEPPSHFAVVHVTADETEVGVVDGDSLAFSRSSVTRLFQRSPEHSPNELMPPPPAPVDAAVIEVARSLQSFQAVQRDRTRTIQSILVAGGTGFEEELAEKVSRRLGVPCVVFEPSGSVQIRRSPEGGSIGGFISCMGLALGEQDTRRQLLNFAAPKNPRPPLNMKLYRRVAVTAAAVIGLASGVTMGISNRVALNEELAGLRQQIAEQREPLRQAAREVRRAEALAAWEQSGEPWLGHLAKMSSAFPTAELAYINSFTSQSAGRMTFQLSARDSNVADQVVENLRGLGYLVEVGRTSQPDQEGYSHVIDLTVTPQRHDFQALADLSIEARRDNDLFQPGREREAEAALTAPRQAVRDGTAPQRRGGR